MNTTTQITTHAAAVVALAAVGMTIRRRDGEYRVTRKCTGHSTLEREQAESLAYYTDTLQDAVDTGLHIATTLSSLKLVGGAA